MSNQPPSNFQPQKNADGTFNKSPSTIGQVFDISQSNRQSLSLISAAQSSATTTVTNNGVPLSINADSVNRLGGTPGTASGGKAIVMSSTKSIGNIGELRISNSLVLNGKQLAVTAPTVDGSAPVALGNYTAAVTPGLATSESIVVPSSTGMNLEVSGLSAVSVQSGNLSITSKIGGFSMQMAQTLSYGDWKDIAHSPTNGLSVMVGTTKLATYANNGQLIHISTSKNFKRVCYADWLDTWIAIHSTGADMTKTPKVESSWVDAGMGNQSTPGNCMCIVRVTTSNNSLVNWLVVAGNGWVKYTSDMVTWTSITHANLSGVNILGMAFSGSVLVMVSDGKILSVPLTDVMLSNAVSTAFTVTSTAVFGTWVDVAYSSKIESFMAISSARTNTYRHVVSRNGVNWVMFPVSVIAPTSTQHYMNAFSRIWYYSEVQSFIIVTDYSSLINPKMYCSFDGANLYAQPCEGSNQISGLCYSPGLGRFIATPRVWIDGVDSVRDSFQFAVCSTAMTTTVQSQTEWYSGVAVFKDTPIILTSLTKAFNYSLDGNSFYRCKINGVNAVHTRMIGRIAYSPTLGLFIAGSSNNSSFTPFIKSVDGVNWVDAPEMNALTSTTSSIGRDVVYMAAVDKFVAFGNDNMVWFSQDAVNWTLTTLPSGVTGTKTYPNTPFTSISFNDTGSIAVCTHATLARVSYITTTPGGDVYFYNAASTSFTGAPSSTVFNSIDGMFYLLDADKTRIFRSGAFNMTSANATTWTLRSSLPAAGSNSITHSPYYKAMVASSDTGSFYVSTDNGATWNSTAFTLGGLAVGGGGYDHCVQWSPHYNRWYGATQLTGCFISASRELKCNVLVSSNLRPICAVNDIPRRRLGQLEDQILCAIDTPMPYTQLVTAIDARAFTRIMYCYSTERVYTWGVGAVTPAYSVIGTSSSSPAYMLAATMTMSATEFYGLMETDTGLVCAGRNNTSITLQRVSSDMSGTNYTVTLPTAVVCLTGNRCMLGVCHTTSVRVVFGNDIADFTYSSITYTIPGTIRAAATGGTRMVIHHTNGVSVLDHLSMKITHTPAASNAGLTFTSVVWANKLGMFIAASSAGISYSVNGSLYTPCNWSGLTGSFAPNAVSYIADLGIAVACGNGGKVAYSVNGTLWRSIQTASASVDWLDITYNPIYSCFLLLSSASPRIHMTSPVVASAYNTWSPLLGYAEKDKLLIASNPVADTKLTHTIETDYSLKTTLLDLSVVHNNAGLCGMQVGTGLTTLQLNHNGTTTGLGLQGSLIRLKDTSIISIAANEQLSLGTENGGLRHVRNSRLGGMYVKNVSATSMALEPAGSKLVVVPDDNLDLVGGRQLQTAKTPAMRVRNVTMTGTSVPKWSPSSIGAGSGLTTAANSFHYLSDSEWPFHNLFNYGMVYAEKKNMLLILGEAISTGGTTRKVAMASYDKGLTWSCNTNVGLGSTPSPYTSTTDFRSSTLIWSDIHNCFLIGMNNGTISYSTDGVVWQSVNATLTSTPINIRYDENAQAIAFSGFRTWGTLSNTDVTTATVNLNLTSVSGGYVWVQELGKYYSANQLSTSLVACTTSTPSNTTTAVASYTATIITILPANGKLFVLTGAGNSTDKVYYKNDNTSSLGVLLPTNNEAILNLQAMKVGGSEMIVAHGSLNIYMTATGSAWDVIIPRSPEMHTDIIPENEGLNTFAAFAGDRLFLLSNTSKRLAVSYGALKPKAITSSGVATTYANRMCGDPIMATALKGRYMATASTLMDAYSISTNTLINAAPSPSAFYVYACDNAIAWADQPKVIPTIVTMTGNWRWSLWNGQRFVVISTAGVVATSPSLSNASAMAAAWPTVGMAVSGATYGVDAILSVDCNPVNNMVVAVYKNTNGDVQIAYTATPQGSSWTLIPTGGLATSLSTARRVRWIDEQSRWVVLGDNVILHASSSQLIAGNFTAVSAVGKWYDIAYGLGGYVLVGDWVTGISKDLVKVVPTMTTRLYKNVVYCAPANRFYAAMSDTTIDGMIDYVVSSNDGREWVANFPSSSVFNTSNVFGNLTGRGIFWMPACSQLVIPISGSNATYKYFAMVTAPMVANNATTVIVSPSTINLRNGRLEIGNTTNATSTAKLHLFTDSAAKPATSTWTTTSDARVKENITEVDPASSADVIKSIPLKYYKWKDQYVTATQTKDVHKVGWLAQDVEQVIPSAVQNAGNMYGVEDCKQLDSEQIIAHMWGAARYLIARIEEKEAAIAADASTTQP